MFVVRLPYNDKASTFRHLDVWFLWKHVIVIDFVIEGYDIKKYYVSQNISQSKLYFL